MALFSCDGGLTWPIQTPLVGVNGSGPAHVICETVARNPQPGADSRIPNADFARMRAGRHGGWGTDGKFYWTQVSDGSLFVCKTDDFGVTWDGIRHPLAAETPGGHVVTTLAFDDRGTLYVQPRRPTEERPRPAVGSGRLTGAAQLSLPSSSRSASACVARKS